MSLAGSITNRQDNQKINNHVLYELAKHERFMQSLGKMREVRDQLEVQRSHQKKQKQKQKQMEDSMNHVQKLEERFDRSQHRDPLVGQINLELNKKDSNLDLGRTSKASLSLYDCLSDSQQIIFLDYVRNAAIALWSAIQAACEAGELSEAVQNDQQLKSDITQELEAELKRFAETQTDEPVASTVVDDCAKASVDRMMTLDSVQRLPKADKSVVNDLFVNSFRSHYDLLAHLLAGNSASTSSVLGALFEQQSSMGQRSLPSLSEVPSVKLVFKQASIDNEALRRQQSGGWTASTPTPLSTKLELRRR